MAGGAWAYKEYKDLKSQNRNLKAQNQSLIDQDQNLKTENLRLFGLTEASTTKLVIAVGKLAQLPVDEKPTVATVMDATKLKGQAFFAKAANGDKVLIFTQAQKAYLYRPSTNKIIEIAPFNLGSN